MTNVFAVVGEHRAEPERLLLLGDDGRYYAFGAEGRPAEVEPSGAWRLDEGASSDDAHGAGNDAGHPDGFLDGGARRGMDPLRPARVARG